MNDTEFTQSSQPMMPRATPAFRAYLAIELIALYVIIPAFIDLTNRHVGRSLIPALGVVGLVLFILLLRSKVFPNRSLWNFPALKRAFPRILLTAGIAFGCMVGLAAWISVQPWAPESVEPLGFIQRNPLFFLVIAVLYPIFSVYPQEIILRTFFFHRYRPLLTNTAVLLTVNALVFAWVHVIFQNWVAVILCIPAGFLFGYTYLKTKSTLASGVEHAIVGNLMWASGLGYYFFAGAVPQQQTSADPSPPAAVTMPDQSASVPSTLEPNSEDRTP